MIYRNKILFIIIIILNIYINNVICYISNSISKYNRYNRYRYRYNTIVRNDNREYDDNRIKINYPIIQVYINSELKTELFCNDDMNLFVRKVKSYLTQLDCEIDNDTTLQCDNIYSEDQLKKEIISHKALVLKLFKRNCMKCVTFDEYYDDLYSNDKIAKYRWIQADVSNIPTYVNNLKSRLKGNTGKNSDDNVEDCTMCNSTGFTPCTTCDGKGLVTRGSNTLFCPTCVGYKKVRCQNCGGKCIRCSD